jgi:CBS domain containing-hemolysin-like protein
MKVLIVPIQGLKRILPHGDLSQVSREEVAAIADLGEEGGVLKTDEETIIHNVLQLREIRVKEVMTPRTVMHWVDDTDTVQEVIESNPVLRYSRMPVLGEDLDDVLGLVLRSSVLTASSKDEHDATMASLMRPIIRISAEASVEDALVLFRGSRQHFALVVDEFGGTQGAITLEDVLETLVGAEFVDELDEVEDLREYAREQAALSGEE